MPTNVTKTSTSLGSIEIEEVNFVEIAWIDQNIPEDKREAFQQLTRNYAHKELLKVQQELRKKQNELLRTEIATLEAKKSRLETLRLLAEDTKKELKLDILFDIQKRTESSGVTDRETLLRKLDGEISHLDDIIKAKWEIIRKNNENEISDDAKISQAKRNIVEARQRLGEGLFQRAIAWLKEKIFKSDPGLTSKSEKQAKALTANISQNQESFSKTVVDELLRARGELRNAKHNVNRLKMVEKKELAKELYKLFKIAPLDMNEYEAVKQALFDNEQKAYNDFRDFASRLTEADKEARIHHSSNESYVAPDFYDVDQLRDIRSRVKHFEYENPSPAAMFMTQKPANKLKSDERVYFEELHKFQYSYPIKGALGHNPRESREERESRLAEVGAKFNLTRRILKAPAKTNWIAQMSALDSGKRHVAASSTPHVNETADPDGLTFLGDPSSGKLSDSATALVSAAPIAADEPNVDAQPVVQLIVEDPSAAVIVG